MAARAFKVIAASPTTLEGLSVRGGEHVAGSGISQRFAPAEDDYFAHLAQRMDEALLGAGWGGSQAALLFPSHQISLRKLEFPFRDARKIDQALSFELENELLEDVTSFIYTYTILPGEDEFATVLVYLVPTSYMHGFLDVLQERQITPIRATFSAQVLHQLHPATGPLHYQVYVGADEAFVSCIAEGHVQAIKSFPVNFGEMMSTQGEGEEEDSLPRAESPEELLTRLREEAEPQEGARRRKKTGWRTELEDLSADIMRFVGPHSLGQSYSLSLHGLFAPLLAWDAEGETLRVLPPDENAGMFRKPAFWGIAEELAANPQVLLLPTSVNFFRSGTGLLQQVREFRRPLAIMACLLVLILGLLGTSYGMRINGQKNNLEKAEGQIQTLLSRSLPKKYSAVQGVRILEERLAKLKKESAASARFDPYRYETMGLLQDLSQLFKDSPQLTLGTLSMKGERFTISGTTKSYNASESFRNRLAELERFKGGEAAITHQRDKADITYRIIINRQAP
jgi:Tfp pilus assembly protein PilN